MRANFLSLLLYLKEKIKKVKIIIVIFINIWILIMLWKLYLIDNINLLTDNRFLNNIEPLLNYIGIDNIYFDTIKYMLLTVIILILHIIILPYYNIIILFMSFYFTRYGYYIYWNYVNNLNKTPQINHEIALNVISDNIKITETVDAAPINWWFWGCLITITILAVFAGIIYLQHVENLKLLNTLKTSVKKLDHDIKTEVNTLKTSVKKLDHDIKTEVNTLKISVNKLDNDTEMIKTDILQNKFNVLKIANDQSNSNIEIKEQKLAMLNQFKELKQQAYINQNNIESMAKDVTELGLKNNAISKQVNEDALILTKEVMQTESIIDFTLFLAKNIHNILLVTPEVNKNLDMLLNEKVDCFNSEINSVKSSTVSTAISSMKTSYEFKAIKDSSEF